MPTRIDNGASPSYPASFASPSATVAPLPYICRTRRREKMDGDTDVGRAYRENVAIHLLAAKWPRMQGRGSGNHCRRWGKGDQRGMMERRDRFGAQRAGEREGEGQWLPLAFAAGGQNLRYRRAQHPATGGRARERAKRASAAERSGAERSGAVAIYVFDCRSQLFGS